MTFKQKDDDMRTERFSMRIPRDVRVAIEKRAAKVGCSKSDVVVDALRADLLDGQIADAFG